MNFRSLGKFKMRDKAIGYGRIELAEEDCRMEDHKMGVEKGEPFHEIVQR